MTAASRPGAAAAVLAPGGCLRVGVNFGNAAIVQRDPQTGVVSGLVMRLIERLAQALAVPWEIVAYPAAGAVLESVAQQAWDVAFLASDPARAQQLSFTAPYTQVGSTYMVPAAAPWQRAADLDEVGTRVAVGRGAAYELYLSRHLQHASLLRFDSAAASFAAFEQQGLSAAAGVRQVLQQYCAQRPHLRVLDDDFHQVQQAIAVPAARAAAAPDVMRWLDACLRDWMQDEAGAPVRPRSANQ